MKLLTFADVDLSDDMLKTPGLALRTAKQVRDDTAAAHGYALEPDPTRLALPLASETSVSAELAPDYGDRLRE